MKVSRMTEIEEMCIGVAAQSMAEDLVKIFYADKSDKVKELAIDKLRRGGHLIEPAKKFMREYISELKKWTV